MRTLAPILVLMIAIGYTSCKNCNTAYQVADKVCLDIKDYVLPTDSDTRLLTEFVLGNANIEAVLCDCFVESIKKDLCKYPKQELDSMLVGRDYRIAVSKKIIVANQQKVLQCYGKKIKKVGQEIRVSVEQIEKYISKMIF